MTDKVDLVLPMPPTVNDYYGIVPGTQKRYLTKKAKRFRHDVAVIVEQNRLRGRFGTNQLNMQVDLYFGSSGDVDNRNKPLLDALQEAHLFENDRQIKSLLVNVRHRVKGGRCEIRVSRRC